LIEPFKKNRLRNYNLKKIMDITTILIIDEDPDFLASTAAFLCSDPDLEEIYWAVSYQDAEQEIRCHNPGLIICDLGLNGVEMLSTVAYYQESPYILITSYYENPDYIKLSRESGGNAFCLKKNLKEAVSQFILYKNKGINSSIFKSKFYLLKQ